MKMKNILKGLGVTVLFTLTVFSETCLGLDAAALSAMLDQGDKVTVIDIRSQKLYMQSHIRDAINIPAGIIARKPLPPIGSVVVCGDGIRQDITLKAVAALNLKTGIQAEHLEGGFAAWQTLNLPSTQSSGMKTERLRYITYEELRRASAGNPAMVLVDLRRQHTKKRKTGQNRSPDDNRNLSDLSEMFPELEVITLDRRNSDSDPQSKDISIAALSGLSKSGPNGVYVLIDEGDGKSEKVARRLHGSGLKQVVILVGGERILQREGRPGLKSK
jgi:rhodanese-related sulfurtransferase